MAVGVVVEDLVEALGQLPFVRLPLALDEYALGEEPTPADQRNHAQRRLADDL